MPLCGCYLQLKRHLSESHTHTHIQTHAFRASFFDIGIFYLFFFMLACVDYFFLFFYYCLADSHTCTRTRSNLQCAHSLRMTTKIIIKKKKEDKKKHFWAVFHLFFFFNFRFFSVPFFFFDWMVLLCSGKVRDARGAVSAFSFFFYFSFTLVSLSSTVIPSPLFFFFLNLAKLISSLTSFCFFLFLFQRSHA